MTPVFDNNGLATEAGELRVFYFSHDTKEYAGWSDEYINIGVSMPGYSTDIDPGGESAGKVAVFTGSGWSQEDDHRGELVYSTENGTSASVDYIGPIHKGYTTIAPSTQFDKWDGREWVTDTAAQHAADIATADADKQARIEQANNYMGSKQWPGKAAIGRLTDTDKAQYNLWLDYLDKLEEVDISSAPDVEWPAFPEE